MTAILTARNTTVRFGGVSAIDGVSLDLERGKVYGLVGPNGSGKTSLVNALSRMGPLTSGTVTFDGEDIMSRPPHVLHQRGLARTFQMIRLLPGLTVRENIMLGADHLGTDSASGRWPRFRRASRSVDGHLDEVIEQLDLTQQRDDRPSTLPYGTQRRVEIARAIAGRPKLLLLDEPVAGMSGGERAEIGQVIRALRGAGLTQLVIEHDLSMMVELCDHLFVLNYGKLIATGPPREVAMLPEVRKAYVGSASGPT